MNKTEWVKRSLIQGQLIVIWYKLSYQPNQFVDLGCKKYSLVLKSEGILYAAWPIVCSNLQYKMGQDFLDI